MQFISPRWKQAGIAFVAAAVAVVALSLSALPGHAQQGPFTDLTGAWSGSGSITLLSGSREHIQCRASYDAQADGHNLNLALRCASDSYNFDLRGTAIHSEGNITGNWTEATNHAIGQFSGRVKGSYIEVRAEGQTFAALLDLTTRGNQQTILIRSPGSKISEVAISLSRR